MGGLGNNNPAIYLTVIDGKVIRRFKQPTENTKARVLKKGPNAGKEVYEESYDYIEGWIKNIIVHKGDYGRTWNVTISDGRTDYILQLDYSSGYTTGFLMTLPNVDFKDQVKLSPKIDMVNSKKKASLFVNQNGTALKWHWTKDNPGDLPRMEQITVKGELQWDDSKMMAFLEDMVKMWILPKLGQHTATSHLDQGTKKEVEDFSPPVGDEPFAPDNNSASDDLPF